MLRCGVIESVKLFLYNQNNTSVIIKGCCLFFSFLQKMLKDSKLMRKLIFTATEWF